MLHIIVVAWALVVYLICTASTLWPLMYISGRPWPLMHAHVTTVHFTCMHEINLQIKFNKYVELWESCSKLPSLFYSEFLSKSLHYAQSLLIFLCCFFFHWSFLQFTLPIKVSYLIPQKVLISLSLMLSLSVLNPEWEASSLSSLQLLPILHS